MSEFISNLNQLCSSDDVTSEQLSEALQVTQEQQEIVAQNTLLQSRLSDWFTLRKYRITGSMVHRVCNYFTYERSNPENIVKAIMEPTVFTSAAMKLGLDLEPAVLEKYVDFQKSNNNEVVLGKLGLMIDTEYGYLAASPDSTVSVNNQLVGIVEVKTKVADKWSSKSIVECTKETSYPLKGISQASNGPGYTLKESSQWFHQIQLQLFVCRSFAQFCDLAVYHKQSNDFACIRVVPDQSWLTKNLPNFQQFFHRFMAPRIIAKHQSHAS